MLEQNWTETVHKKGTLERTLFLNDCHFTITASRYRGVHLWKGEIVLLGLRRVTVNTNINTLDPDEAKKILYAEAESLAKSLDTYLRGGSI